MDFTTINYIGVWSEVFEYDTNDAVSLEGLGFFMSIIDGNLNANPIKDPEFWVALHNEIPIEPINDVISPWDEAVTYAWGESVTFDGRTYASRTYKNINNPPTDEDFWVVLPKYDVLPACGSEYIGEWNAKQNYLVNQVVSYGGNNYTAVIANTNQEPGVVSDTIWKQCSGVVALPNVTVADFLYDPNISVSAGQEVFTVDGYRAKALRDSQGASILDTRFYAPSQTLGAFDIDAFSNPFAGAGLTGKVYSDKDQYWLALADTSDTPKEGSPVWKRIAAVAIPEEVPEVITLTGESIVTKPEGLFLGQRTLVSNFYMKFRNHVYHWKNNDQWRLHNKGEVQTTDGARVDFELVFYISYKGLRKIIDFIHIITNANQAFNNIDFITNFTANQTVLGSDTKRYKLKEGEHRITARQKDNINRVRGNWVKVTIERKKEQSLLSFNITTVKSKSRNSH